MNNQEAFDRAVVHLMQQGCAAREPGTTECRYRVIGADGTMLKCAVGALIPAELYKPIFEGTAINALRAIDAEIGKLFAGVSYGLLRELQGIHDRRQPYEWPDQLRLLAITYSLNTAALDPLDPDWIRSRNAAGDVELPAGLPDAGDPPLL